MIIKIRPVSGGDFEIDVDADTDVETLKAIIISTKPELGDDPDDVKLIYKGKILSELTQTIEQAGVKDNEFLAMMVKSKPKPAATAAPPAANAAPVAQAGTAAAQPDVMAAMQAMAASQQQQAQQQGGLLGQPPEEVVNELCNMGFPRDQVLRALRAAFNNPDRAMGFLLDDNIPPEPAAQGYAQQPTAGGVPQGGAAWPDGMLGPQLMTRDGMQPTSQALGGAAVVLLYFSAHWCPPCRQFTPGLARGYTALGAGQKQVQVVFCSGDRDLGGFMNYFASMPWVALPFGSQQKDMLGQMFQVRGIPSVVALDGNTGRVLDQNARNAIGSSNFDLLACCRTWGVPVADTPATPAAAVAPAPVVDAAPPKKPEPDPVTIDTEVVKVSLACVAELEVDVQEAFFGTLLKVLNNVLQNPQEPKFRSLKKGNAALQSKLFGVADGAAVELLQLAGFDNGAENIALGGPPDGRCTSVRNAVQAFAEAEKMRQLRQERDAKIDEEKEKDKKRRPETTFGGNENGRHDIGRKPARGGG